jgi:flagellar assembly protein FliH
LERTFLQQTGSTSRKAVSGRIEAFQYPVGSDTPLSPEWYGWADDEEDADKSAMAQTGDTRSGSMELPQHAEIEKRMAEETRRAFDAGREQGCNSERDAQAAMRIAVERERAQQAAKLIERFTEERDRYMQSVEHEVVKLALAVAARILRREAQMDPLLLTGAVRVALGQLSGSTQVRLHVPAAELDLWNEAIVLVPNLAVRPTVIAGEGMRLGDCMIETELGSVDLGIRAQLGEIERGFFDRAGGPGSGSRECNANEPAASSETVRESRA